MLDEATAMVARGAILRTLKLWDSRNRHPGKDSAEHYMSEVLLQAHLAMFEHIPLPEGELRSLLTYLKDKGLVLYKEVPVGREVDLVWRIFGDGTDVLEGRIRMPGIKV